MSRRVAEEDLMLPVIYSMSVSLDGFIKLPNVLEQRLRNSVRHVDTDCDTLLMSGVDRESARAQVHQRVEDVVNASRDGVAMLDE
jgi:hypothetical protein